MSQGDIMQFLNQYKHRKFTTKQIANEIGIGRSSAQKCLQKLRKHKFVKFNKQTHGMVCEYLYWINEDDER